MNNKELIAKISEKIQYTEQDVELLIDVAVSEIKKLLSDDKSIVIQGFGAFEVRKKLERLTVHPETQQRLLVPPKLVVNFKQSTILKDKLKVIPHYE